LSVNVDPTGEVWFRWKARYWDDAMELLERLELAPGFPEGWQPFSVRINKRPLGKGAGVSLVIGYRRKAGKIPRLTFPEAAAIYEQVQLALEITTEFRRAEGPPGS